MPVVIQSHFVRQLFHTADRTFIRQSENWNYLRSRIRILPNLPYRHSGIRPMGRAQCIARNAGRFHHPQSYSHCADHQESRFHLGTMDWQSVPRRISKPHSGPGKETDGRHLHGYHGTTDYIQHHPRQLRGIWATCTASRLRDGTKIGNLSGYGFTLCFLSGSNRAECSHYHHSRACFCWSLASAGDFPGSYHWRCFPVNQTDSRRNIRHYFSWNDLHEHGTFVRFRRCSEESERKADGWKQFHSCHRCEKSETFGHPPHPPTHSARAGMGSRRKGDRHSKKCRSCHSAKYQSVWFIGQWNPGRDYQTTVMGKTVAGFKPAQQSAEYPDYQKHAPTHPG